MPLIASALLTESALRHGIRLQVLVAETGLWANPEVHRRLAQEPDGPAFFPNRRRYRAGQGEVRGQRIGEVVTDDNSYANLAIKRAIGMPREEVIGFEACHIWPLTCYSERLHTVIANLVLLPRALASLTDHSPEIQAALQYRAWELYGWYPADAPQPPRPDDYPTTWREPMPFNSMVATALAKRTLRRDEGSTERRPGMSVTRSRDYTRYDIRQPDGTVERNLPKRRIVLALVRALIAHGIEPAAISAALPALGGRLFRSAPGRLNTARFVQAVQASHQQKGKSFDPSRYFCAEAELLKVGGRTYALSNQWGDWTGDSLSALLTAFPDTGITVTPTRSQ